MTTRCVLIASPRSRAHPTHDDPHCSIYAAFVDTAGLASASFGVSGGGLYNNAPAVAGSADLYGARIGAGGSLPDPSGFAVLSETVPEVQPAVADANGHALLVGSILRRVTLLGSFRNGTHWLQAVPAPLHASALSQRDARRRARHGRSPRTIETRARPLVAASGSRHAYSFLRTISSLYLVEGLVDWCHPSEARTTFGRGRRGRIDGIDRIARSFP